MTSVRKVTLVLIIIPSQVDTRELWQHFKIIALWITDFISEKKLDL